MSLLRYRAALSVGSTLCVVLALWFSGLAYIANKSAIGDEVLADIEPRYARLEGLRAATSHIELGLAQARVALAAKAYPAAQGLDRIGPEFQQKLRTAAESAGVSVAGSQIATPAPAAADQAGLDVVQVLLTLDAQPEQLLSLFEALSAQNPAIYLDALELQPASRMSPGRLAVRATFSVLRVRE